VGVSLMIAEGALDLARAGNNTRILIYPLENRRDSSIRTGKAHRLTKDRTRERQTVDLSAECPISDAPCFEILIQGQVAGTWLR
jgi:hypothetical protein